ncbi:MAG: choice-of-anchor M domain-containing protein [Bifidobacteriaceae bacterium]|jgi:surface-anchored protein|nr:choice-of-anchor M domain-containing protein [Bifidobacteriaceae bacterium]
MRTPVVKTPWKPPALIGIAAITLSALVALATSAVADPAGPDVGAGTVWVGLSSDGAGGYGLGATVGETGEPLSAPIRVASSARATIPEGDEYAWWGEARQQGWSVGSSSLAVGLTPVNLGSPTAPWELIGIPVTWRLSEVVAPEGGTYSFNRNDALTDGALPAVDSGNRFGTGTQRDGSAQGAEYLDETIGEMARAAQFFTAEGMYCVTYDAELTLPGAESPSVLPYTIRYAIGDDTPSNANCGTTGSGGTAPDPGGDDIGQVTLIGRVWNDLNEDGVKDDDESVFSGLQVRVSPGGGWSNHDFPDRYPDSVTVTTDAGGRFEVAVRTTPVLDPVIFWGVSVRLPAGSGLEPRTWRYRIEPSTGDMLVQGSTRTDLTADGAQETVDFPLVDGNQDAAYVLAQGHADVLYPELTTDGSGQESLALRAHVDAVASVLDYDDFVIDLTDPGLEKQLPATYTDSADYSFIAPAGSTIWNSGEGGGSPWIGMATQSPTLSALERQQPFSFTLDAVTGPGGTPAAGNVVMWTNTAASTAAPRWSTVSGTPSSFVFAQGSHSHFNWSFTAQGVYCLAFSVQTDGTDGLRLRDERQLTFVVGPELDPSTVTPCEKMQDYPQRQLRSYPTGGGATPVVTTPSERNVIGLDLTNGTLGTTLLRRLPDAAGQFTSTPLADAILYAPAGRSDQAPERPYMVNMPGWDTAPIAGDAIDGDIVFSVTNVHGPGNLSTDGSGRFPRSVIDTGAGQSSYDVWTSAIGSTRWMASRPGKYCVDVDWMATTTAGEPVTASAVLTLVVEGPLDPADVRQGGIGYADGAEVWLAADHGALEATCSQEPDSWTRADDAPAPGDTGNPDDPTPVWDVPNWTTTESGATILNLGHIDVASLLNGNTLETKVKDTTLEGVEHAAGEGASWHAPEDVVLQLLPESWTTMPDNDAYSFLGEPGSNLWQVTQTQQDGLLWPGWSTETIPVDATQTGVKWTLTDVAGPGEFTLYASDPSRIGAQRVFFNTRDGITDADSFEIPKLTHAHGSWAFSAEGVYCLAFDRSATLALGQHVDTEFVLAFAVGEVDVGAIDPAACFAARPVTSVAVSVAGGAGPAITSPGGALQLVASVLPADADDPSVRWEVVSGSAATVSDSGLVTAVADGTAVIRASARDGLGVHGEITITITGQTTPTDPGGDPTDGPGDDPTDGPTGDPTDRPTDGPTGDPTDDPTGDPTGDPTDVPPAPVDEGELIDARRGGVDAPEAARPGQSVTVTVSGHAGARVRIWLHSAPALLGTFTLDRSGRVAVVIPAGSALGEHKIVVQAMDGSLVGWDAIRLEAAGSDQATTPPVTGQPTSAAPAAAGLPVTGASGALPLLGGLALVLVLVGTVAASFTRRRVASR